MLNLRKLKEHSVVKRFPKDAVVIREGDDDAQSMYIILKGQVGIYKHYGREDEFFFARLGAGNFVGESAMFLGKPHSADVVALEPMVTLKLTRRHALDFFQEEPGAALSLIRTLCARLDKYGEKIFDHRLAQACQSEHDETYLNVEEIDDEDMPAEAEAPAEPAAAETRAQDKPEAVAAAAPHGVPVQDARAAGLFPPGHKSYSLEIPRYGKQFTYSKTFECPCCRVPFNKLVPRGSSLKSAGLDPDLRPRYKGFEPVFFEVVSCPACSMSAFANQIDKASVRKETQLMELLMSYQGMYDMSGEAPGDINTLFAGMYLAVLCAPLAFPNHNAVLARLYHRLSWLYGDCGDSGMRAFAENKALELYLDTYQTTDLTEDRMSVMQMVIGELSFRAGNMKTATEFFYKVRANKKAPPVYRQLAEDRFADIRKVQM